MELSIDYQGRDLARLVKLAKYFNIEIQSVLNSQCVSSFWENSLEEFRVQFNAKQSSIMKLLSHP